MAEAVPSDNPSTQSENPPSDKGIFSSLSILTPCADMFDENNKLINISEKPTDDEAGGSPSRTETSAGNGTSVHTEDIIREVPTHTSSPVIPDESVQTVSKPTSEDKGKAIVIEDSGQASRGEEENREVEGEEEEDDEPRVPDFVIESLDTWSQEIFGALHPSMVRFLT